MAALLLRRLLAKRYGKLDIKRSWQFSWYLRHGLSLCDRGQGLLVEDAGARRLFDPGTQHYPVSCHRKHDHDYSLGARCSCFLGIMKEWLYVGEQFPLKLGRNVQCRATSGAGDHNCARV